ncbi:MAG: cystathionine beta-lyase [Alphaproteobacteria bacterium]
MTTKETILARAGHCTPCTEDNLEQHFECINPPIHHASTVIFKNYAHLKASYNDDFTGANYADEGVPIVRNLEDAMTQIEDGYGTKIFPTGLCAITVAILAFTKAGDHILFADNVYSPTREFSDAVLPNYNISATYFPSDAGVNITEYIQPNTTLIFMESPGSNTFEIQDVPAITKIAKERGILTMLDNSWATPLFFSPFEKGVDFSIQSITKYISGHSDLLQGAVSTQDPALFKKLKDMYKILGIGVSVDDCYLTLRGMRTLAIRLEKHQASALEIATWLEENPAIKQVIYPALPSHPQHALWKRDFTGAAGIFSFLFKDSLSSEQLGEFVDSLSLFRLGYSWGGHESLVMLGKQARSLPHNAEGETFIRLQIGLEDPADLMADLTQALKTL